MRAPAHILTVAVLAAALLLWHGHSRIAQLRREKDVAEQKIATLEHSIANHQLSLATLQQGVDHTRASRNAAIAQLSRARAEQTPELIEDQWPEPPADWPRWEPDSRYVWISKELLKQLPVTPFDSNGALNSNVSDMLALNPEQRHRLTAALNAIVDENRKLEAETAHTTTNHLVSGEGEKVTVVIAPDYESTDALRGRFHAALRSHLGLQQYELVKALGNRWMAENFPENNAEPKTISVVRHPDGSYALTRKGPNQWMSTSGFLKLDQYVPRNLLSFFAPILGPKGEELPSN